MKLKTMVKEMLQLFLWVIRYMRSIIRKNRAARITCNVDKKILIVGNGSSVSSFDFFNDKFKNHEVMCVNFFAIFHPDFFSIKPRYYCIIDPVFFEDYSAKLMTADLAESLKTFGEYLDKVDWEMSIILISHQRMNHNNKNINFIYLNNNTYNGVPFRNILFKSNLASSPHQNVLNAALYYAITAKLAEIYHIGFDYDAFNTISVDDNNDITIITDHFYEEGKITNLTKEGYLKNGELYYSFYSQYVALKSLSIYSQYAEYMGVRIYNISPISYIDTFERKRI